MQCAKCGFVMSELDPECLRCKRLGEHTRNGTAAAPAAVLSHAPQATLPLPTVEEKECPRCGKATTLSAILCDKCGYEYHPESSRAERYQALLAQETAAAPPSSLRQTIPPAVSWGIIAACLLVVGGAGWGMFGGSLTGGISESTMDSPILIRRHVKPHAAAALQAVTYSVTGTATQAFVSYRDASGALVSPAAAVTLPWTQAVKAKAGAHLTITALPSGQSGTVLVLIEVGGTSRKSAGTPGADGRVSAEDTL